MFGFDVYEHQLRMWQHQSAHPWAMILGFRGSTKSTCCNVLRVCHELTKDPDVRILMASRSGDNMCDMLEQVRTLLQTQKYVWLFGEMISPTDRKVSNKLNVAQRENWTKEPNVTAVGKDSSVASKHYDIIIGDDLVDKDTGRTFTQRNNLHRFFYETLVPTLDPQEGRPAKLWMLGTRYHHEDLYGHLRDTDMANTTLVVAALETDEDGNEYSVWPEKFPTDYLVNLRTSMGRINFDAQYQCDASAMRGGGVVDVDDCREVQPKDVPEELQNYIGVDVAIGQGHEHDYFYLAVGAFDPKSGNIYIHDKKTGRFSFNEQRRIVQEYCYKYDVACAVIETIGYQRALFGELKRKDPMLPLVARDAKVDKLTRLQRRQPLLENGQVHFTPKCSDMIDQLVRFPDTDNDDAVDAFDHVVHGMKRKQTKPRRKFGLIH